MLMDGGHEVNEVFFDDVEVPVENRVHEEGKGWTVAKYLLGHERMNTARIGTSKRELEKLKEYAARQRKDGRPLIEDPRFRDKLARARDRADGAGDHQPALPRPVARRAAAGRGGLDAQDQGHRDPAGADRADDAGRGPARRRRSRPSDDAPTAATTSPPRSRRATATIRKTTIYAGSNEIQRNIIAKHGARACTP